MLLLVPSGVNEGCLRVGGRRWRRLVNVLVIYVCVCENVGEYRLENGEGKEAVCRIKGECRRREKVQDKRSGERRKRSGRSDSETTGGHGAGGRENEGGGSTGGSQRGGGTRSRRRHVIETG